MEVFAGMHFRAMLKTHFSAKLKARHRTNVEMGNAIFPVGLGIGLMIHVPEMDFRTENEIPFSYILGRFSPECICAPIRIRISAQS